MPPLLAAAGALGVQSRVNYCASLHDVARKSRRQHPLRPRYDVFVAGIEGAGHHVGAGVLFFLGRAYHAASRAPSTVFYRR